MDYSSCVKELEEKGYRVIFRHWRYPTVTLCFPNFTFQYRPHSRMKRYYRRQKDYMKSLSFLPYPKGGKTEAEIQKQDKISREWETICVGESHCMTIDNFCYREGRSLALSDAMKRM